MTSKTALIATILVTVVSLAVILSPASAASEKSTAPDSQFFELRIYTFTSAEQHALVEGYWEKAAIPALNRLGIKTIGVFNEIESEDNPEVPRIVVLIPYDSLAQFAGINDRLNEDKKYTKNAAAYMDVDKKTPAYAKIESHLLHALKVKPKLKAPDTSKDRIFEMREYQGHSEKANDLKMQMFNDVEADIFAESGLTAVFYSKTIIGKNRPSLFYMVTFDDMDDHAKDWDSFRKNPRWAAARKNPKYEGGGVSDRSTYMLRPAKFSQI